MSLWCFPVEELVRDIERCQSLRALRLEGNTVGVEAAKAIAKALESKVELQVCIRSWLVCKCKCRFQQKTFSTLLKISPTAPIKTFFCVFCQYLESRLLLVALMHTWHSMLCPGVFIITLCVFQRCHWSDMFTGRLRSEIPVALVRLTDTFTGSSYRNNPL